jgi:hypothetical protein
MQWFPPFSDSRTGKRLVGVCEDRNPIYLILYSANFGQKLQIITSTSKYVIFN